MKYARLYLIRGPAGILDKKGRFSINVKPDHTLTS